MENRGGAQARTFRVQVLLAADNVFGSSSQVLQSVLTGNLAANARLKLGAFGLDRWLDLEVAATGSDDHDRTNLVPVALIMVPPWPSLAVAKLEAM